MKHSRRQFLQVSGLTSAALIAAPVVVPSSVFGDDTQVAPSERITVGHIGVGNQGGHNFRMFQGVKEAQSVATADCFKSRREGFAAACKGKAYADYRELIADPKIDAVVICTPDHNHVPLALAAAKAKKGAYVEKPLGLTIAQNLLCEKVFAENGVQFQYGTQQRSQRSVYLGNQLVHQGAIGKIVKIEVDAPDGHGGGSKTVVPLPADLGEDGFRMWLGDAPKREYTADTCKPDGTYMIYDFSIGYLGGWGAHPLDMMVWACDADLSGIVRVEGTGQINKDDLCDAVFHWDMKIKLGDVDFVFKPGTDRTRFYNAGGDWIQVGRGSGTQASKPELLKIPVKEENALPVSTHHQRDFILAVRDKRSAVSHLTDAVRSDNISQLCDIAIRTKSVVKWDPKAKQLVDATAEQKTIFDRRPLTV
ncbi:MAG: Gfo/Idh/MocA family oxidoreductase [Planctomycetaceae bacterium]|jgi:predicted dehydrogenase|nr:Gfo/Idh/MocA family oxidoreductase [Planctomycetaceae bacterium]